MIQLRRALRIVKRDILAFTGAGGKTTAMFQLAGEMSAAGQRVIITTTTRIYPPDPGQYGASVALTEGGDMPPVVTGDEAEILRRVRERLDQVGHVVVAREYVETADGGKLAGIRPEFVAALRDETQADMVLVEADGAHGRCLKAPAAHEPVIPQAATCVVVVAGLSVLGCPLSDQTVHRPERVMALTGLAVGELISEEAVVAVLADSDGGLKGIPVGARAVALLNQADDDARLEGGRIVAARLLRQAPFTAVCIAALSGQKAGGVREVHDRVAAVVLAAGAGRRFGGPKQLALWRGRPLLAHVLEAVLESRVNELVVVVGYEAGAVSEVLSGYHDPRLRIVMNHHWPHGQSTSIHTALRILSPEAGAALFVLADQPRLTAQVVDAILGRRRETLARICVPTYAGQRGNPVLFDRDLFPELLATSGDVGGRFLIQKHAGEVAWVPFPAEASPGDVDQLEDLRRL